MLTRRYELLARCCLPISPPFTLTPSPTTTSPHLEEESRDQNFHKLRSITIPLLKGARTRVRSPVTLFTSQFKILIYPRAISRYLLNPPQHFPRPILTLIHLLTSLKEDQSTDLSQVQSSGLPCGVEVCESRLFTLPFPSFSTPHP